MGVIYLEIVTKERLNYIDTAKGILMILVVLGHVLINANSIGTVLFKIIYAFHMPAFFIISGILFNTEKWKKRLLKEFVVSRAKHILVPYLFFEIVGLIFHQIVYMGNKPSIANSVLGIFTINCNVGADWFLITYFIAMILYFCCEKYGNKYVRIILLVIAFGFVFSINGNTTEHIPIVIGRCLIGYAFIYIGHAMKKYFLESNVVLVILSLIILCISAIINPRVELYFCIVSNPIFFLIGSISGTYFILNFSKLIQNKITNYIGQNTIPILGTHQNILDLLVWLFGYVTTIKYFVFTLIIVFIGEAIILLVANRICPALIGKKKF